MKLPRLLTVACVAAVTPVGAMRCLGDEDQPLKLADCPAAVQKTFQAEARGIPIGRVTKEIDENRTVYWTTIVASGRNYSIGVAADGTLKEVSLEADEDEVAFAKCPPAVQAAFRRESNDAKIESVDKDVKHGTIVYETVVAVGGRDYAITVAQDGTLVGKTLVVEEDDIELTNCPAAVQKTLHDQALGGRIGSVTRSTGIVGHVYEAEAQIDGKDYVIEVAENGVLISKWIADD